MAWSKKANLRGPRGEKGDQGNRGLPGVNAVPADTAVGGYVAAKDSATAKALDLAYLAVRNIFSGVNGWAYGNSYVRWPNDTTGTYPMRLPAALGFAVMNQAANGGFRMQDTVTNAFGPDTALTYPLESRPWPTGSKGVVVLGDLLNNLIEADTAANRATALESARAFVALVSASSRIEQTAFTFSSSPPWANTALAGTDFSGGSVGYTNPALAAGAENAYVDIAIPAGVNYLTVMGIAPGIAGAAFVVREGATVLGTIETDQKSITTSLRATGGRSQIVFRIPGTAARTIRVTVKNSGASTRTVYGMIDCVLPQTTTPPLIIMMKPLPVLAATHNKPALLTYLRTVPDTVAAEFSNVLVVDALPGWDTATMLNADLLHPNELGQQHLADAIVAAIVRYLLNMQRQTAFGVLT